MRDIFSWYDRYKVWMTAVDKEEGGRAMQIGHQADISSVRHCCCQSSYPMCAFMQEEQEEEEDDNDDEQNLPVVEHTMTLMKRARSLYSL